MAPRAEIRPTTGDDFESYDVDDFATDPFADSGGEAAPQPSASQSKKRKEASGLGIDEAVNVAKKARAPAVKLDEERLLSEEGLPKLRRKAGGLKFKGKGHEFSDAARLLSFYQLWLDDLFPKAQFVDALAMVEKQGHKRRLQVARMEWIDEGKPKPYRDDDDEDDVLADLDGIHGRDATIFPARVAPIFQQSARASERPKTPPPANDLFGNGVPDEDDIYGATPRGPRTAAAAGPAADGAPDDDELDALMAEEEASRPAPSTSLFGDGGRATRVPPRTAAAAAAPPDDEDDLDALMAEAEAQTAPAPPRKAPPPKKNGPFLDDDDEDDLDALIAEAEGHAAPKPGAKPPPPPPPSETRETADADEEEAMAEMEGLW